MVIEVIATSRVKYELSRTSRLDPTEIKEGDREPSLDGKVKIYTDKTRKKENVLGDVVVQVKGEYFKDFDFSKETIKYPVNKNDLINFRTAGGAIFFVVMIDDNKDKIYYKKLSPFIINEVLLSFEDNQKDKSLEFKQWTSDRDEMLEEFINFYNDCDKQGTVKDGRNRTIEEVQSILGKNEDGIDIFANITLINKDPANVGRALLNHDICLFAGNKNANIAYPIKVLDNIIETTTWSRVKTEVNGKVWFDKAKIVDTPEKEVICLGEGVCFIKENNSNNVTLSLKRPSNLSQRLLEESFVLECIDNNGMTVNGRECKYERFKQFETNQASLEILRKDVEILAATKQALDRLGVSEDLSIADLSNDDRHSLDAIITNDKKGIVRLDDMTREGLNRIKVSNLFIHLNIKRVNPGYYTLNSFFKSPDEPFYITFNGEDYQTTPFVNLYTADLVKSANIDYKAIEKSINCGNTEVHFDVMRAIVLRLLDAYDITGREPLLETAQHISKKLHKLTDNNPVDFLNIIQCNKRKRDINKKERSFLNNLLESDEIPLVIRVGASILLNKTSEAKVLLEGLDEATLDMLVSWPIYKRFMEE